MYASTVPTLPDFRREVTVNPKNDSYLCNFELGLSKEDTADCSATAMSRIKGRETKNSEQEGTHVRARYVAD